MIAPVLIAVLAAAPVLEPDPGGFKRLQPRQVDASSFLANGWNQFAQNYLPIYVGDDDPGTAWVEGVDGVGIGETLSWLGPRLHKARAFRIFIRSGYQKSQALFTANARPKGIRIEPLTTTEVGSAPSGKAVELELADVVGWQKVELPVPAEVSGFRLTIRSAYPGTKYQDLCISDVRVYVDGEDPYQPALEQQAAEKIRKFVAERRLAAKAGVQAAVELAPKYRETVLATLDPNLDDDELHQFSLVRALQAKATGEAKRVLDRARPFAQRYESQGSALQKHPVRVAMTVRGLSSRASSLAEAAREDPPLATMLRYLSTRDFGVFEGTGPDVSRDMAEVAMGEVIVAIEKGGAACVPACKKAIAKAAVLDRFAPPEGGDAPADCAEACSRQVSPDGEYGGATSTQGIFVDGTPAKFTALFRHASEISGDRDATETVADELLVYDDGLAGALIVASSMSGGSGTRGNGHLYLFDWDRKGAHPRLARVYRITLAAQVTVSRFDAI